MGHPSGCCPVVLDGILVQGPRVDGSSSPWLAVCMHGELRSVAVILFVLDGFLVRGPLIDGSSRLWLGVCLVRAPLADGSSRLCLAVCIHGKLRSVAVIESLSCYDAAVGVVPASPSIVAVCFHVLCPGVSLAV